MTNDHRGARYYDLAHGNPISDTDTSGWFGGVSPLHLGGAERARKGSMTHCAIDPFLALVTAKEAHQIGARIYSATTTEYIRDV